ncbi:MAG: helix-turn-helix domain-containing protein [Syntrophus sp. (in: bacteria)]
MEKISIVKRRKKGLLEPGKGQFDGQVPSQRELTEVPTILLRQSSGGMDANPHEPEEFPGDDDLKEAISIKLTPEQYNLVKSSQYVDYFLNGKSSCVSLDMRQRPDGQIVFNFQFKKADTVKMLTSQHVCLMLQISKSFLMNLVKTGKIRSYKIGRLRRFLLEDILDYLSKSEDIINPKA